MFRQLDRIRDRIDTLIGPDVAMSQDLGRSRAASRQETSHKGVATVYHTVFQVMDLEASPVRWQGGTPWLILQLTGLAPLSRAHLLACGRPVICHKASATILQVGHPRSAAASIPRMPLTPLLRGTVEAISARNHGLL